LVDDEHGLRGAVPLSGRIEKSCRRRPDALPAETRRLLRLAAADPVGEPSLLWRAAGFPPPGLDRFPAHPTIAAVGRMTVL